MSTSRTSKKKDAPAPQPPASPAASPREVRIAGLALALVTFAVYAFTLYPSLPSGDGGELVVAAYNLGVAHPPGYPLFTMLGKLFTLLPFGSVGWRVNLFSAVAMVGAVSLSFLTVTRATGRIAPALFGAGLFAFSTRTWALATGAEVFALNTVFAAALVFLAFVFTARLAEEKKGTQAQGWSSTRIALLGAFLVGLGLTNHHTLVFFGLPLVAFALWVGRPALLRPATFGKLAGLFALGLVPYVYLPIAAAHPNAATWGDETTLAGFFRQLLRAEYGTFRLGGEAFSAQSSFATATLAYAKDLGVETLGVGGLLALLGLVAHLGRSKARADVRPAVAFTLGAYLFYVLVFHAMTNLPLDRPLLVAVVARFWIQANVVLFLWAGLGFATIEPRLRRAALPVAIAAVVLQLGLAFRANDQHDNDLLHRYAEALLRPLPQGALVLTRGDVVTNSARYLQLADGERKDLAIRDLEMLTFPWMRPLSERLDPDVKIPGVRYFPGEAGAYDLRTLLEANLDRRRIFLCGGKKDGDPSADADYDLVPFGLCEEIVRKAAPVPFETWAAAAPGTVPDLTKWPARQREDSWEQVALSSVFDGVHRHGLYALNQAIARNNDAGALRIAAGHFDRLLAKDPSPNAAALKNAGITYNRLAQYDPSVMSKMIAAWKAFLATAPNDPDAPAVREALRPYEQR